MPPHTAPGWCAAPRNGGPGRRPQRRPRPGDDRPGGLRRQRLHRARPAGSTGSPGSSTDPDVGAVAPRVRPAERRPRPGRAVDRFARAHSPLDLGPDEGEVGPRPGRPLRARPPPWWSAGRRSTAVGGFDPDLRVGEDVDLVWRLVDAGWRVRYEPVGRPSPTASPPGGRTCSPAASATARRPRRWPHAIPVGWPRSSCARGRRSPPSRCSPDGRGWPPSPRRRRRCRSPARSGPLGIPSGTGLALERVGRGWTVIGPRPGSHHARRSRSGRSWLPPGSGVGGPRSPSCSWPPVVDWVRRRPDLDLVRWVAASVADDVAYGAGVWTGSLRARSASALVPAVVRGASDRRPDTVPTSAETEPDR